MVSRRYLQIECIEWSAPLDVYAVMQRPTLLPKRGRKTVYLVELHGVPLYVGCTSKMAGERLVAHRSASGKSPLSPMLRVAVDQRQPLTVRATPGSMLLEAYAIRALKPSLNQINPRHRLRSEEMGLPNRRQPRGDCRKGKLTSEQREEIRRRGRAGEVRSALAAEFGVSGALVTKLCNEVWADRHRDYQRAWQRQRAGELKTRRELLKQVADLPLFARAA